MSQPFPGPGLQDPRRPARFAQIAIALYVLVQGATLSLRGQGSAVFAVVSLVSTIVDLTAFFSFLIWFQRCRNNAQILAPGSVAHAPGWATGAWFTPVLMWWRPRRIALDLCRNGAVADAARDSRLVNAWWGAWLAMVWSGLVPIHSVVLYAVVHAALSLVAGVLVLLVIERITAVQTAAVGFDQMHPLQRAAVGI